jgi:hypothetical protein
MTPDIPVPDAKDPQCCVSILVDNGQLLAGYLDRTAQRSLMSSQSRALETV